MHIYKASFVPSRDVQKEREYMTAVKRGGTTERAGERFDSSLYRVRPFIHSKRIVGRVQLRVRMRESATAAAAVTSAVVLSPPIVSLVSANNAFVARAADAESVCSLRESASP